MLLFVIWNRYQASTLSISIVVPWLSSFKQSSTEQVCCCLWYWIGTEQVRYLYQFIWFSWIGLNRRIPNKYVAVYDVKLVPSKYAICINLFPFIWLIWTVGYQASMLLLVISNRYRVSTLLLSIDIIWLAWFEFLVFPVFRGIIHTYSYRIILIL